MSENLHEIIPIFVVGSPRSGTTLIGALISSSETILNLGEFGGFYLTYYLAKQKLISRMPSQFRQEYLRTLQNVTKSFALETTKSNGSIAFCDHTPSNIFIASELTKELKHAIFIVVLRHYSGVVQSLQRSFAEGYEWAGETIPDSAALWVDHYRHVFNLPASRTIPVSYDSMCVDAETTSQKLLQNLSKHFNRPISFNPKVFCNSYANSTTSRPTIGKVNNEGKIQLDRIESFDKNSWDENKLGYAQDAVNTIDSALRHLFPFDYIHPNEIK